MSPMTLEASRVASLFIAAIAVTGLTACGPGSTGHEALVSGTDEGTYSGLAGESTTASIYDLGESSLFFSVSSDPHGQNGCSQLHLQITGPTRAVLGPDSNCSPGWSAESATFERDGDDLTVIWTNRFTHDDGTSETRQLSFEGQREGGDSDADDG